MGKFISEGTNPNLGSSPRVLNFLYMFDFLAHQKGQLQKLYDYT